MLASGKDGNSVTLKRFCLNVNGNGGLELMNNMGLIVSECGYGAKTHSCISPPHPAGFC